MLGGKLGKFLTYHCDAQHWDTALMLGNGHECEVIAMIHLLQTVAFWVLTQFQYICLQPTEGYSYVSHVVSIKIWPLVLL